MQKSWEEKWERYSLSFGEKVFSESASERLVAYCQTCVLVSNLSFSYYFSAISSPDYKLFGLTDKAIQKKLARLNQKKYEHMTRFFLIDYFIALRNHAEYYSQLMILLETEDPIQAILPALHYTEQEKRQFKKYEDHANSVLHSKDFLFSLGFKAESNLEPYVLYLEETKKEFFSKLDQNIGKLLTHYQALS